MKLHAKIAPSGTGLVTTAASGIKHSKRLPPVYQRLAEPNGNWKIALWIMRKNDSQEFSVKEALNGKE